MTSGGIYKSLCYFVSFLKDIVDIDLMIWSREKNEMPLPDGVHILNIPTAKSVRASMKKDGVFSMAFFLSCLGALRKKRWRVMPRLKEQYDIAISYTNGGYPKYFVIDKVSARKKYSFYHNGAYKVSDQIKELDEEYYPKFDKIFAVSRHVKELLLKELSSEIIFDVIPNFIDYKKIVKLGEEVCSEMSSVKGSKILTVSRLSVEKNILKCVDVARVLKTRGVDFTWFIAGDGDQRELIAKRIEEYSLSDNVILLGNVLNPYKYMRNCDLYAQFSVFEADPITLKEVLAFNKLMVLSDIEAFDCYKRQFGNISLCENDVEKTAELIIDNLSKRATLNRLDAINDEFKEKIKDIIG